MNKSFENLSSTGSPKDAKVDKRWGEDRRTYLGKVRDWLKIIAVIYLLVVHGLAALYLTNTKLVLELVK